MTNKPAEQSGAEAPGRRTAAERSARPIKRSFAIAGHRTSVSLEEAFWIALKVAADEERVAVAAIVARIDQARGGAGLSSAIRVWLLARAQAAAHSADPR